VGELEGPVHEAGVLRGDLFGLRHLPFEFSPLQVPLPGFVHGIDSAWFMGKVSMQGC
jgi:hypothetical protein